MSKDLNKVMIIGRLGAEPVMRFTPQGTPVATFRVASGHAWKDGSGATQEATEWFRVVAWNKLAEVCNEYLRKGSRVYIEGRLQTRKWTGEDGQDRFTTEVIASDMIMLDSRSASDPGALARDAEESEEAVSVHPVAMPASPTHASNGSCGCAATPRTVAHNSLGVAMW